MKLAAVFYLWVAHAAALAVVPPRWLNFDVLRGFAAWALAVPILVYLEDPVIALPLFAILLAFIAPLGDGRVAFFLLVVPSLPLYLHFEVPFVGINTITTLTLYKAMAIVVLIPAIAMARRYVWSLTDSLLILFLLYNAVRVGMALGPTPGLRAFVDLFLLYALPYFAFRGAMQNSESLQKCMLAWVVLAAILSSVSILCVLKSWDIYRLHAPPNPANLLIFRDGILRIEATISSNSLAFVSGGIGILGLEYMRRKVDIGFLRLWLLRALFLAPVYFSGSRGSMMAVVIAIAAYTFLNTRSTALRVFLFSASAVVVAVGGYWLLLGKVDTVDPYGTFVYRQMLLDASLEFLSEHFWLGRYDYMTDSTFAHLVQGQGIIDITNYYLQVALELGALGLALIMLVYLIPLATMTRFVIAGRADAEEHRLNCILVALTVGWLAFVTTTSATGLTLHIGLFCAAAIRSVSLRPTVGARAPTAMPLRRSVKRVGEFI